MSDTEEKLRQYLKRVTVDLGQTRQRLREVEERLQEPVAIVSMACRFPGGVTSPEDFWELVSTGGDAIGEFPTNRGWDLEGLYHPDPDHPGTSYVRRGGFLDGADQFDAPFFGISPREALAMDPQQRLLLEVSWEVLERAGLDAATLKGTPTGVYAGAGILGFGTPHIEQSAEGYLLTGNTLSVVSGRVAFTLGLEGPAVTVDTACSSSLVAMHLAAQALRQGECTLALAGGVTVMPNANLFTEFSRQRGLAPDGRCKPFAAAADGTGFSEGAGMVLLERLSDARRNGHRVLAVLRGSAINQDGASNGLTAPNGPSQQRVIRQALANAELSTSEVDVVEAHGTGTTLGDPIEADALMATYGQDRAADQPLWLGSAKSNIGHTQGASGVASVIKMVMAMRHGLLPASLHIDAPTSHVDWSGGGVRLLTEPVAWHPERPRRAGVSAFGISGTNAHLILEQAPEPSAEEQVAPSATPGTASPIGGVVPWVVSAHHDDALRAQAEALTARLATEPEFAPDDVGWSLITTRATFDHRAVVVGDNRDDLLAGLAALAAGEPHAHVINPGGPAAASGVGPVLVFPGQGSQWVGMGAGLLEASPVFAARVGECERALAPYVEWSLSEVLRGGVDAADLGRVDVVQPVLWAVMVSLAAVWADQGVTPAAVVGHSQGEIAAAVVAGALTLEDGARVVALRSKALRRLAGGGAMASLAMSADKAVEFLAGLGERAAGVGIAAVNGPGSAVVSGPPEQVQYAVAACEGGGGRARLIDVDYASHSAQVDEIAEELHTVLAGIEPVRSEVAFYSTVTAERIDTTELTTAYWVTNLREQVRFADAVRQLLAAGHRVFIEASTHPVLTVGLQEAFEEAGVQGAAVPTLRRDQGGLAQLAQSVALAFAAGLEVDWTRWFRTDPRPGVVELPTYAFQRQRYWLSGTGGRGGDPTDLGLTSAGHPLLGAAVELADGSVHLLTGRLSAQSHSWLSEHVVGGTVLVPGAALVEWALRAADEVGCAGVDELALQVPLALPATGGLRVQVVVSAASDDGRRDVRVYSHGDGNVADESWVCHAEGVLSPPATAAERQPEELSTAWPPPGAEALDVTGFYDQASAAGYGYGPAFQGLKAAWRQGSDVYAEVELPEAAGERAGFGIHPALLDAALQPALLLTEPDSEGAGDQVWLPFAWNGVALWATEAGTVRVRLSPYQEGSTDERAVRVTVADTAGAPVLTVDSVVTRPAAIDQLKAAGRGAEGLFAVDWVPLPGGMADANALTSYGSWAVLGADVFGLAETLPGRGRVFADVAALLDSAGEDGSLPSMVLVGVQPDDVGDGSAVVGLGVVERVVGLVQAWLAEPVLVESRLVVVTRGAVVAGESACGVEVAGAGVWGLVRSAESENPGRFLLLDLDAEPVDPTADGIGSALWGAVAVDESQVALRGGRALVPRLVRARVEPREEEAASAALNPAGTVLIVGGTGVLGALVAEHVVRAWQVKHLVLASRRGPDAPGVEQLTARLVELGAEARIVAADVTRADEVTELVASIAPEHPLTGVVHAAGVLDDAVVTSLSPERLARVWAAKAAVAEHLHTATAGLDLGMFVMFSSAAAVFGSPGQGNYAAANAFCDALAAHRRSRGLPGVAIAWGLWADSSGMTGHLTEADLARMTRSGIRAMTSEHALRLLDSAGGQSNPQLVAADVDLGALSGADHTPAVLRGLVARTRRKAAGADAHGPALASRLAGLDAAGRLDVVLRIVRESVAVVLGFASADDVRAEATFKELGFDSLTAVELRNRLSGMSGLRLPATLVFDYPTPRVLAEFVVSRLGGESVAVSRVLDVAGTDEPVAIIGMACRFPGGAPSPEGLWDVVASGRAVLGDFPTTRGWDLEGLFHPDPDNPGTSYAREGAFLYDADRFDAGFFGINPREALATDPQQRLLLEASWEVLERAGIDPVSLKGSATGVYAGVMYHDYAAGLSRGGDAKLEGYAMLAGSGSVVSGRVAYSLGLEGPAVTVDTACSSSLVAMHLAAQALRQGECTLALAGGVTVMATPDVFTGFSRQRGLAPDGQCKPFAAAANGTGWGEGVGLLLLERLSDARRNGHRVLAVVRGSAVNQDGASNGLTAPNGPSQQRVIRQALANARLSPADVDAVEAHGTGTTLGDPIEAQAVLATYGQERSADKPLWLGSIKSNIGHTQAAAGVAGVIKMVMAMRKGVLPPSLHIDEPTPHVEWDAGAVRLLTEAVEWPQNGHPRRAGVSSFGASGTNAHVIIEHVPDAPETSSGPEIAGVLPWLLSARSGEALRGQAKALAEHLTTQPEPTPTEVGWSLLTTRSLFDHRAVVVGDDRAALLAGLEALAAGDTHPAVVPSNPEALVGITSGHTVFLFSGQGSQRPGMGRELYERFPVYARTFDHVCDLLDPHLEHPLKDVVFTGGPDHLLDHTTYAQAGLFALHIALAKLLETLGVRPDAVIGHSIGEVAAAHIAGVFDLPDACHLVAQRATLMGSLPTGGAMATIAATPEQLAEDLAALDGQVTIAALNTPGNTVISGPADLVEHLRTSWADKGHKAKALTVSHAFHSPLMDPILEPFTQAITGLTFHEPTIPLISNLTGLPADPEEITTPTYWAQHIRQPVHFHPAITHTIPTTHTYLELGPDPTLTTATQHTLEHVRGEAEGAEEAAPLVVAALTRKQPEVQAFAQAVARLHVAGAEVDWTSWFPANPAARTVDLPTYAFQGERYWLSVDSGVGDMGAAGLQRVEHALLPAAVGLADGGLLLTGRVSAGGGKTWLAEHVVAGSVLLPGAVLAEWALRAADEAGCAGIAELALQVPLVLPANGGVRVQVVVSAASEDGLRDVRVYSRPDRDADLGADAGWLCHAEGVLSPPADGAEQPAADLAGAWPPAGAEPVEVDGFYERIATGGYEYGPAFQGLRAAWRAGDAVYAEVELPEAAGERAGYGIHPALLDAALHAALLLDGGPDAAAHLTDERVWLPYAWHGVALWAAEATTLRVRLSPNAEVAEGERGLRVTVADAVGAPVLSVDSLAMRAATADQLRAVGGEQGTDGLFALEWTPLVAPAAREVGSAGEPGSAPEAGDGWAVLGQGDPYALRDLDLPGALRPTPYADIAALTAALDGGAPAPAVVLFGVASQEGAFDGVAAAGLGVAERLLELAQEWLAEPRLAEARLVVVTRGAVPAGEIDGGDGAMADDWVAVPAAGAWGLIRSAQAENPGRFVLLDLDPAGGSAAATPGAGCDVPGAVELAVVADESQVALRAGRVLVPRLVRAGAGHGEIVGPVGERAWRLELQGAATVDNVVPVPCPEILAPLAPGQVRVEVHAAGINFRDVLLSLGMVPGQVGLGGEGAGVVTAVGPGVTNVAVGDRVLGLFDRAFGPLTLTDARMVAPVPDGWSFHEAASVPTVFLTAWYGLVELGGLRAGESVLIHAATGGVGMAAVQIARYLGAEVYATASPGKHAVLEELGIDAAHRANSRELGFEAVIREATGGRGVDVVLNSLAGEFVDASLRLLGAGGRLLEMGKTDIRDADQVAAAYPGVSYQVYDLVTDAGPAHIGHMLGTLSELFAAGALTPPPVRVWPLGRARHALRYLSQAKHTGKLVLDVPATVDPDGTVLITGGTGTLGALVAEHLVRTRGLKHLLLVSRRGRTADGAEELAARLARLGAQPRFAAVDVTDAAAIRDLIAGIDSAHPLTGVIHAAGVLDDAVLTSQSREGLARVWATKATAAAHLHTATAHLRLGMFVLFSSSAATFGSPGQANYAAANAFCDALAAHRQAAGLPGVSIAWGLWANASGMTGNLADADLARMARSGIAAMASEHALGLLDAAVQHGGHHLVAADINPRALAAQPADSLPASLRTLIAAGSSGNRGRRTATAGGGQPADWADRLVRLSPDEQLRTLVALVRSNAATVLGHADAEAVHAEANFKDLGFDSLTAVELRNRLSAATGLRLPAALVFDYPEPTALADFLLQRIAPGDAATTGPDAVDPVLNDLARLENALIKLELEDGDSGAVTARLESLLAKWKAARKPAHEGSAVERLESASADQVLDFIDNELGVS
ncbi:type I polyketide synthase [Streptomyces zagrosensis]|uniref:Polyketide synthase 12 n=1 Tax=Streptomyces zagrosensis TaxID=1042984 RepID=A0A7W9QDF8_9ACTN|nr:type I polyketide synthase [Streptomyces zagrosensis]MBB5936997.1 polyketide synthase 12 [Streptomyces zagrosensis]